MIAKIALNKLKETLLDDEIIVASKRLPSGDKRKEGHRIYLTVHTDKRNLFVKYDPAAASGAFKREYGALMKVSLDEFIVPQPIKLMDNGIVMSEVAGVSIEKTVKKNGLEQSLELLTGAVINIANFHKNHTCRARKKGNEEIYKKITGKKADADAKTAIDQANFGFMHGDLDPFNMLYSAEEKKLGLIDWENFREDGIQELDALHFIIMLGVIANPKISWRELYGIIFKKNKENPYLNLLERYCAKRSVPMRTTLGLIPIYCETQNHRLAEAQRDTKKFLYNDFKKLHENS